MSGAFPPPAVSIIALYLVTEAAVPLPKTDSFYYRNSVSIYHKNGSIQVGVSIAIPFVCE